MSREIRFRAWNKLAHKMAVIDALDFMLDAYRAHAGKSSGSGHLADIELMQFTGLTDKHDRDIYEGDIVLGFDSGHYGKLQKMRIEYRLRPFIGFCMVPADGLRPHLFGEGDDIEVIGNIYENSELLKEVQS